MKLIYNFLQKINLVNLSYRFLRTALLTTNFAILEIFNRKRQFLQNAISLVKLLLSCHSGNQIFAFQVHIFSSLDIMNNQNSFELLFSFVFNSFLNCVLFFFPLHLATFERSSYRRCSIKNVLKNFAKLTGKYLCRSRTET